MQKWEFLEISYNRHGGSILIEPSGLVDIAWMEKRFGARIEISKDGGTDLIDRLSHKGLAKTELLTYLGTQGWEPVAIDTEVNEYFFKRPIED